jgi:hypothetical protein
MFVIIISAANIFSQSTTQKVASLENLTSIMPAALTPQGDTLYNIRFAVNLIDTVNVNKINVKVGTTFNGNDIYEGNYYIYEPALSDTSITRDGLRLTGDAGAHFQGVYFYKVTAEDFQGTPYTPYIKQQ